MERENLSALMDGELNEKATQAALQWMRQQPEERQTWNEYHLIGDVLRGVGISHIKLGESIAQRLAQEPTLLAPRLKQPLEAPVSPYARWSAVAAAISVVALAGWALQRTSPTTPPLVASAPAPVQVVTTQPVALRQVKTTALMNDTSSAEMERFAALHRQFTPLSGFQSADFEFSPKAGR
jgi:sigma-E factor negative regulatory protein RseA